MLAFQVLLVMEATRIPVNVAAWQVAVTVAVLWTPWVVTAIAVWKLRASRRQSICWPEFERQLAEYIAEQSGRHHNERSGHGGTS